MDTIEKLIKAYLKNNLDNAVTGKTGQCPDELVLLDYLHQKLEARERCIIEDHLAQCGFCLSQLSMAFQTEGLGELKDFSLPPSDFIERSKAIIKSDKSIIDVKMAKQRRIRKNLFLAGTLVSFILSFLIHKYFMQFLVATLILGLRWALESDSARTLIMVVDSWRKHSHDDDEEISRRLKSRV